MDVIYGGRSGKTKAIIDLFGMLCFFMPVCIAMMLLSLNFVADSFRISEMSSNAGGLLRWPVKALIPLGFGLLILQGLSEIFKRIGFLRGPTTWTPTTKDPCNERRPRAEQKELWRNTDSRWRAWPRSCSGALCL